MLDDTYLYRAYPRVRDNARELLKHARGLSDGVIPQNGLETLIEAVNGSGTDRRMLPDMAKIKKITNEAAALPGLKPGDQIRLNLMAAIINTIGHETRDAITTALLEKAAQVAGHHGLTDMLANETAGIAKRLQAESDTGQAIDNELRGLERKAQITSDQTAGITAASLYALELKHLIHNIISILPVL